ncbi:MAG: DnaD domain protein [Kiritimatiellales bacterium]
MSTDGRIEELAENNETVALMWPWFITAFDDWGRLDITDIGAIRLEVFPAFPGITRKAVSAALDAYCGIGLLHKYIVDERTYVSIRPATWMRWQNYLKSTKRASTQPQVPPPMDAPWGQQEECGLIDWLTKSGETRQADNPECPQTFGNVRRQSRLSVPSPSPSPPEVTKEKEERVRDANDQNEDEAPDPFNAFGEVPPDLPKPDSLTFYISNYLPGMTAGNWDQLAGFLRDDGVDDLLVKFAIDEACAQNKSTWAYVRSILDRWVKAKITTIAGARAEQERFKAGKQRSQSQPKPTNRRGPDESKFI